MPRKRRETRSYEFDPEVRREIEKQAQAQQEIENRRKKRTLIFWGGAIFGIGGIAAISIAFLLLLGLVEWQANIENTRTLPRKKWLRPNIDYHFVEPCAPYKIWDEHGMKFTVYTMRYVLGPKPEVKKRRR